MANLTITVNERVLRRARIRALEQGTSVNKVLGEYLQRYAGTSETEQALADFLEIVHDIHASSGADGRAWTREDLYDRPALDSRR